MAALFRPSILLFHLTALFISEPTVSGSLIDDIVKERDKYVPQMPNVVSLSMMDKDQNITAPPHHVYVGMYIESVSNIRPKEMMYLLDIYFRLSWIDSRLEHDGTLPLEFHDKLSLSKIWRPDIYFPNAVSAIQHDVTSPNLALYVESNGTVSYSLRVTLEVSCNMDLSDYPMDRHKCTLQIMSYGHVDTSMELSWFPFGALDANPSIKLPQFEIMNLSLESCDKFFRYSVTKTGYRAGTFSCLMFVCHLKRLLGFHVLQTFAPTAVIVMISWVSFWIDRTAVPTRVTLSFTTLLTLFTQGSGIRYSLPPVSYSKAIDYWFSVCIMFVLAALLEFTIINSLMRSSARYLEIVSDDRYRRLHRRKGSSYYKLLANSTTSKNNQPSIEDAEDLSEAMRTTLIDLSAKSSQRALFIDQMSRVVFPASFGIFGVVYWTFYLQVMPFVSY